MSRSCRRSNGQGCLSNGQISPCGIRDTVTGRFGPGSSSGIAGSCARSLPNGRTTPSPCSIWARSRSNGLSGMKHWGISSEAWRVRHRPIRSFASYMPSLPGLTKCSRDYPAAWRAAGGTLARSRRCRAAVPQGGCASAGGESDAAEQCWRRILTLSRPRKFASLDQGIYGHLTRRNLAALAKERAIVRKPWAVAGGAGGVPGGSGGGRKVGQFLPHVAGTRPALSLAEVRVP